MTQSYGAGILGLPQWPDGTPAGGNYVGIDHWDCIFLAAYGPKHTRLVLLFADEPQDRRLVLFDAWITSDTRVDEEIVVEVIVRRGDLPNDTLV